MTTNHSSKQAVAHRHAYSLCSSSYAHAGRVSTSVDERFGYLPYFLHVAVGTSDVVIVSDAYRKQFFKRTYLNRARLHQPVRVPHAVSDASRLRDCVQGASCPAASSSHIKAAADVHVTKSALRSRGFQMTGCHHNRYHVCVPRAEQQQVRDLSPCTSALQRVGHG